MGDEIRPGHAPRPDLPDAYLHRPRIDALLEEATQRRLSVLVAPAGSGKTMAVAGWAATHDHDAGRDIRWLPTELGPDGELTGLRGRPAASRGTVLVLDDADQLPMTASRMLERLLDEPSDGPSLLLVGRRDPERLPMALRLREEVAELGYADLRFEPDEAGRLMRSLRPGIDGGWLQTGVEQCRGWAAGLVLTAQAPPPAGAGASRDAVTPRPLLEYLSSDVLPGLPPDLRHLLTAVCQEPDIGIEEATALSGLPDAAQLLAEAAAEGFLVERAVRAADDVPVWRMHPLLTQVLRRHTAPNGPDWKVVTDAHHRAADHYSRAGDARAALRHAMLTGELYVQLRALRRYAVDLLARGDAREVAQVLELVPPAVRTSFVQMPALEALVLRALGRYEDAKDEADKALTAAERPRRSERIDARSRDTEADLAILDVWQARCGWRPPRAARTRATTVLGCARRGSFPEGLDHDHDTTGVSLPRVAWLMLDLAALELWSDDLESAAVHVAGAESHSRLADLPGVSAGASSVRALLEVGRGSYRTAAHTAEATLDALALHAVGPGTAAAHAHVARGLARFQALDLEAAAQDLAAVDAARSDPFSPILPVYRRLLAAQLLIASGDAPGAARLLADGDAPVGLPRTVVRALSVARVHAAAWMSDVPAIEATAGALRDAGCALEAGYAHGLALGLRGNAPEAVAWFDRVLATELTVTGDRPSTGAAPEASAAIAIARVAFLLRTGTPDAVNRARHLLPDALTALVPQRLLWPIATGQVISPALVGLLEGEGSRADGHPFADVAATALRRQPRRFLTAAPAAPTPTARETAATLGLTPRELDVLEAVAAGGSKASVASTLYLSENTVKTHLAAVYRKLGVTSRADAIASARRSGLL